MSTICVQNPTGSGLSVRQFMPRVELSILNSAVQRKRERGDDADIDL